MITQADAQVIPLPSKSVHAVITSPPYFGPRKYAGEQARDWPAVSYSPMPGLPPLEVPAMRCELGREKTPEAYTAHLVLCFREVRRVLRDDGTCWVVEGDSYAANRGYQVPDTKWKDVGNNHGAEVPPGLKQGDLMAIPYRLLLALQADGWLVRNDVVWSKVAPMPESVSGTHWERHQVKVGYDDKKECPKAGPYYGGASSTLGYPGWRKDLAETGHKAGTQWIDCPGCEKCSATGGYVLRRGSWRHTRSHEAVLMLTKGMGYYSDQERVRETLATGIDNQEDYQKRIGTKPNRLNGIAGGDGRRTLGLNSATFNSGGRNPRDVLTPSPSPFKGEHYAAFPPDLIRPLILSSAPLKCCPVCGAGWAPVIEQSVGDRPDNPNPALPYTADSGHTNGTGATTLHKAIESRVLTYHPTCACYAPDWLPGLVLDPFTGSGTTGLVCRELGLRFVGLDISDEYLRDIALARSERLTPAASLVTLPMFAMNGV